MYIAGQNEVLRVGWVAGSETLGRQSIFLSSWERELARQGVSVRVFCPKDASGGVMDPESIRRYTQPHWLMAASDRAQGLAELVQSAEVDVLHALDESAIAWTSAVGDRLDRPYFLTCQRLGTRLHLPHKGRRLSGILAPGGSIYQDLHQRRVTDDETVHLLRPGVWIADDPKPLEFRDRRAMVLADVYDAPNGVAETVLRSFAAVKDADGGAMFFLLHSERQERTLRRKSEALGLSAEMTFVVQDAGGRAMHVIQSADIFIAAGGRKEFDWGALLAMASGTPVLAIQNDVGDFLSDGMTAALFSPQDGEGLTGLLNNVLTDPAWGRAQAQSALQYLHVYHNPIRGISDLAKLYRAATNPEEPVAAAAEAEGEKE
ncbi:MAG: hypothetical protein JXA11_08355 [Phycisphaerae bacterium]|nr:hypothetical protein [Phycisphaerae bacterium]